VSKGINTDDITIADEVFQPAEVSHIQIIVVMVNALYFLTAMCDDN